MILIDLKRVAKRLGKNATEIARDTGVNRNTINALMSGKSKDVKLSTLSAIASTYSIPLCDLIKEKCDGVVSEKTPERRIYKQEGEIVPFTCWPVLLASQSYRLIHEGQQFGFGQLDFYFKDDYGFLLWDHDALKVLAERLYDRFSEREAHDRLLRKYRVYAAEVEQLYSEFQSVATEDMNDDFILSTLETFRDVSVGFWEYSLFIDSFDVGVDLTKMKEIAAKYNLEPQEVEILSTPSKMTFSDERKADLLSFTYRSFRNIRNNDEKKTRSILDKHADWIERHRKEFDYYKSNYSHVKHVSREEIEAEILGYLEQPSLLEKEYKRLGAYSEMKRKEITAIVRRHRLQENPLWFFASLTYWREHRKKVNLMGIHVMDVLLQGIEKKLGIRKEALQYLSFDEVGNVLKGLISGSVLERRRMEGVLISATENGYRLFESQEARSIKYDLESMIPGDDSGSSDIIVGQTASQGYAKGIARIMLTQEDFGRFHEGEILITSMTRPEFVPLMKKAAGIVTNEGGITCHAAIVSRELGKPCVTGAKNATQRIREGDLVEVRANHATVRILKRNDK